MMKRMMLVLAVVLMALVFTACGDSDKTPAEGNNTAKTTDSPKGTDSGNNAGTPDKKDTPEPTQDVSDPATTDSPDVQTKTDVLVVFFSATGTTKAVGEKIAAITGADVYEIKPATEYTSADLNWNDSKSRSTKEQNDASARPAIGSETISLAGYKTVYIGYPIWWGEEPRIMDTFVESYNFDGITMIPFCTSGSSGIGSSGKNLENHAGSGTWLDGKRFGAGATEQDVRSWIEGLGKN